MDTKTKIERMGGPNAVGLVCGISRQAVCQWTEIPAHFVLVLAAEGILTPHQLRRDLYPHPLDGTRKKNRASARRAT